jgi:hypothetical protein
VLLLALLKPEEVSDRDLLGEVEHEVVYCLDQRLILLAQESWLFGVDVDLLELLSEHFGAKGKEGGEDLRNLVQRLQALL